MIRGIDVSIVQGDLTHDWPAIARQGVRFAYLKCGQGNDRPDPYFARNVSGAREAGLAVGAYHFVYPLPVTKEHPDRCPLLQARVHFEACRGLGSAPGELPPAVDLEWPEPQDWAKWGCTAESIRASSLEYLEECERLFTVSPLVYTYPFWAKKVGLGPEFAKYRLWEASYTTIPLPIPPWSKHTVWQDGGGKGRLPNGAPVDTNRIEDETAFQSLLVR